MSGTAYQWVFDNAESISIELDKSASHTISRDQTVLTAERGTRRFKFTVTMPNGMPWDTARQYIAAIEKAGTSVSNSIKLNNSGYASWLSKYQGTIPNGDTYGTIQVTYSGTQNGMSTANVAGMSSGYKWRAGDFVQLASGGVYQVTSDVAWYETSTPLSRVVTDTPAGPVSCHVGSDVTWNLICVTKPTSTIFARNQVSWSGPFVFYETTQV